MFDNIARKIKTLATVLTIVGMVISFLVGFAFLEHSDPKGIWVILIGPIAAYTGSFLLYSWGHFIEDMDVLCGRSDIEIIKNEDMQENQIKNNTFR